jgi:hypothetical protein
MNRDLGLVHLASESLGIEPFKEFITSYRAHDAGIEHELIVVYNGFPGDVEPEEFAAMLGATAHRSLFRHPRMVDLAAYLDVARCLENSTLCFVNSNSVVLADNWLACMYRHLRQRGIGLVGATGSWESHLTALGEVSLPPHSGPVALLRRFVDRNRRRQEQARHESLFAPFPNHHIRTNAFMIAHDLLVDFEGDAIDEKLAAHALESGKNSITAQVRAQGLQAVVVGRDCEAYEPARWRESATFRAGDQRNLLVADNRTRQYANADAQERALLERAAWGAVD